MLWWVSEKVNYLLTESYFEKFNIVYCDEFWWCAFDKLRYSNYLFRECYAKKEVLVGNENITLYVIHHKELQDH